MLPSLLIYLLYIRSCTLLCGMAAELFTWRRTYSLRFTVLIAVKWLSKRPWKQDIIVPVLWLLYDRSLLGLAFGDLWGYHHQNARCSVHDRSPSVCKISAESVQRFRRRCVPSRQTNSKLDIPPSAWGTNTSCHVQQLSVCASTHTTCRQTTLCSKKTCDHVFDDKLK